MKDDVPRDRIARESEPPAQGLRAFLTHIDARAFLVTAFLILGVVGLVAAARAGLPTDWAQTVRTGFETARASFWSLPIVIATYTALAFVGAPQFLLIGATVAVFDPVQGALYAWIATLAAAVVTFLIGQWVGAGALRRFGGPRLHALSTWLNARGVAACALIRITPSAPFAVINACAGVSHIPIWKFAAGTGLGVIPKIGTIALLGAGVEGWAAGGGWAAAGFAGAAIAGWILLVRFGRDAVGRVGPKPREF